MKYLVWTVVALIAYTVFPPLVNVATREVPSDVVTLVATTILALGALCATVISGDQVVPYLTGGRALPMYAAGVSLTIGTLAYYRALAQGPVSVVVPVFGTFIVTSSLLGIVVLDEPASLRKLLGVGFAVLAVYFIAG